MTPNYFTKICIETRDKMRDKRWYQLFSQDMYFWNKNVDLYHWYIIDSGSLNALLIVYKCLLIYYIQWITYCFRVLNGSEFNKVQIISYYIMHSRGGPFLIQPSRCIFIYLFIKCIVGGPFLILKLFVQFDISFQFHFLWKVEEGYLSWNP